MRLWVTMWPIFRVARLILPVLSVYCFDFLCKLISLHMLCLDSWSVAPATTNSVASLRFLYDTPYTCAALCVDLNELVVRCRTAPWGAQAGSLRWLLWRFANYWQKYVLGFVDVENPLTELTKKGVSFQWGLYQRRALAQLKHAFFWPDQYCFIPICCYWI